MRAICSTFCIYIETHPPYLWLCGVGIVVCVMCCVFPSVVLHIGLQGT